MKINARRSGLLIIGLLSLAITASVYLIPKQKAPAVDFTTITGNTITMASLKGRPVVVSFWSTTCSTCFLEMPHLTKLYHDYHQKGLELIAITLPLDMPSRVLAIVKANRLPYPVVLDPQGLHSVAFGEINATPTNFLVNPDGDIVVQRVGLLDLEKVRPMIDRMLKKNQNRG